MIHISPPAMAEAAAEQQRPLYEMNWIVKGGIGVIVLTNSSLHVVRDSRSEFPCHDSHKPNQCSAQIIGTQTSGTNLLVLRLTSCIFDRILVQVKFDISFLDQFIDGRAEVLFPMPIEKTIVEYRMDWVIMKGKNSVVLTNPFLPVVRDSSSEVPCHNSHMPVKCSAEMIGTQTSGTNPLFLRLTSPMFGGQLDILVKFDHSFLDQFIDGGAEVLFPMPIEKPMVYGMITHNDKKIILTDPCLPFIEMSVLCNNIPMTRIKYQVPKHDNSHKVWQRETFYPQMSKTPNFDQTEDGVQRRCALPTSCLSVMPCHEGHVPVRCNAKIAWVQILGSEIKVILSLSSKWLKTPIYVELNTVPSFLNQFICGEIQVFFPMQIRKHSYVSQKLNQVWSTVSNNWELIRKPKPRDADWKWNGSTAWVCELDPTNSRNGLKPLNRTGMPNCWPHREPNPAVPSNLVDTPNPSNPLDTPNPSNPIDEND